MRILFKALALSLVISLSVGVSCLCFSQSSDEQRQEDKYESEKRQVISQRPKPKAPVKYKITGTVGIFQGYENNVRLDPSRKGDHFTQEMVSLEGKYALTQRVKVKAGYDLFNSNYYDFTEYSTLDNTLMAGFETKITDNIVWDNRYEFEYLYYYNDDDGKYFANRFCTGLKHLITKNLYHKLGYEFQIKDYESRKIRNGAGVLGDEKRQDYRSTIKYDIAVLAGKTLLKLKTDLYFNDSNDEYLDYYDYKAYSLYGYASRPIAGKLSGILRAGCLWKRYDERTITTGADKEKDHTMILGAGLMYELTKNVTVSGNYTYRQNYSNDPIQRYSESVATAGLYYSF